MYILCWRIVCSCVRMIYKSLTSVLALLLLAPSLWAADWFIPRAPARRPLDLNVSTLEVAQRAPRTPQPVVTIDLNLNNTDCESGRIDLSHSGLRDMTMARVMLDDRYQVMPRERTPHLVRGTLFDPNLGELGKIVFRSTDRVRLGAVVSGSGSSFGNILREVVDRRGDLRGISENEEFMSSIGGVTVRIRLRKSF